jgi:hypothetical protein
MVGTMGQSTAWDSIQPGDIELWGPSILDRSEQKRWCRTVLLAGTLPHMWKHKAGAIRRLIYDQLALKPGDRVLIIGERVESCGFAEEIGSRVGTAGEVKIIDITEAARQAYFAGVRGSGGQVATWGWDYSHGFGDGEFDCVAVLQAVQHAEDWRVTGKELLRVMKGGRKILLAEIGFSPKLWMLAQCDIHLETWVEKMFGRAELKPEEMPYYSPQDLRAAFDGLVDSPETFVWKGIELFWGSKPA